MHRMRQSAQDVTVSFWRLIPHLGPTLGEAIMLLGEDGSIHFHSPPLLDLLGCSRERINGTCIVNHLAKPSRDAARNALRRMREDGERFRQWHFCFRTTTGEKKWLLGRAVNFLKDPRLGHILVCWKERGS